MFLMFYKYRSIFTVQYLDAHLQNCNVCNLIQFILNNIHEYVCKSVNLCLVILPRQSVIAWFKLAHRFVSLGVMMMVVKMLLLLLLGMIMLLLGCGHCIEHGSMHFTEKLRCWRGVGFS